MLLTYINITNESEKVKKKIIKAKIKFRMKVLLIALFLFKTFDGLFQCTYIFFKFLYFSLFLPILHR